MCVESGGGRDAPAVPANKHVYVEQESEKALNAELPLENVL